MDEKTYIMIRDNGTRAKITVPADWKVTFGPAARGDGAARNGSNKMPMALRFYESETKQRAIFTDVVSFRDADIQIQEEKVSIQEKEGYMECDGKKKRTIFQAKVREWVNPDIENTPALMPPDGEMFDGDDDI